jgi:hypothetical protein
MIWKQWNGCIFKHAQPSICATTVLIKEEALRWAKAGAHGLRVTLPTTWDVHESLVSVVTHLLGGM